MMTSLARMIKLMRIASLATTIKQLDDQPSNKCQTIKRMTTPAKTKQQLSNNQEHNQPSKGLSNLRG
jgi:hypothetical protein